MGGGAWNFDCLARCSRKDKLWQETLKQAKLEICIAMFFIKKKIIVAFNFISSCLVSLSFDIQSFWIDSSTESLKGLWQRLRQIFLFIVGAFREKKYEKYARTQHAEL